MIILLTLTKTEWHLAGGTLIVSVLAHSPHVAHMSVFLSLALYLLHGMHDGVVKVTCRVHAVRAVLL